MKPVLFSVSYAGFWGQDVLDLDAFVSHASELGFPAVELMAKRPHLSVLDYDDAKVKRLASHCKSCGVEVACIAGYTDFAGGTDTAEVPALEMQIHYICTLARLAQALGCPLVRVFTSYERPHLPLAKVWDLTVSAVQMCCDAAAPLGVTIGVQNHHDLAVGSRALQELLLDVDRPNCRLMFDPWSVFLRDEPAYDTARTMAEQTVYTTLADYVRFPRYRLEAGLVNYRSVAPDWVRAVPIGEGEIPNLAFLQGLSDGGYDGPVAYEMCSPIRGGGSLENLDACAKTFLQWFREHDLGD